MTDDFVRDLEEELVAAARARAARRRRRFVPRRLVLPRHALRGALVGAAALALVAVLAALALDRAGDDRAADERRAGPPPAGVLVPLAPMLDGRSCRGLDVRDEPARGEVGGIGLFARTQHANDAINPPQGNEITWIPVRTFDPRESRLAGYRRLQTAVHAFPSLGVSTSGACDADDGPGVCLVEVERDFRCFTQADVMAGRALARTPDGLAIGIVPDGVEAVRLTAGAERVDAEVVENVYAVRLGAVAGTPVRVTLNPKGETGCERAVAPELLARFGTLRRAPEESSHPLPRAAVEALRFYNAALVESGARFWGGGGGIEWWAVPVVPPRSGACAPATMVCVVAVPDEGPADAFCGDKSRKGTWKAAPLQDGRTLVIGFVPDGVTGARITIDGQSAEIDAAENILGGAVPFPYRDTGKVGVELIRRPRPEPATVAVVNATGGDRPAAEAVLRAVRGAGLRYVRDIVPGIKPQPRTDVYWRPGRATQQEAESVAELLVADAVRRVVVERAPAPVLATGAGIVVVVGSGD